MIHTIIQFISQYYHYTAAHLIAHYIDRDRVPSHLHLRGVNNMYICECCEFRTVKENNFKRHLSTNKHIRASRFISGNEKDTRPIEKNLEQNNIQITVDAHLSSDDEEDGIDEVYEEIGQGEREGDRDEDQREDEPFIGNLNQEEDLQTDYYPFKNKLHLLLYILKNSPTHAVVSSLLRIKHIVV